MREDAETVSPRSTTGQHGSSWSPLARVLFRLGFCVIALYTLDLLAAFFQRQALLRQGQNPGPFPIPFTAPVWHHVVPWIGSHLLRVAGPIDVSSEIGGDSPYEYILRGTELAAAAICAAVWSVLDRARREYRTLNAYLRVFVRVALAGEMLFYGLDKVFPIQFGVLTLYRRAQPLGELWPMAMLWAFMAASPGYTLLCGLVEVLGGGLLLIRRTTTLGALLSVGAMANVLALNVFYDVNQKIRCVYYLGLACYLAAPQVPGLWRLLVRQQAVAPVVEPPVPGPRRLRGALSLLPLCLATLTLAHWVPNGWHRYQAARQQDLRRGPNYGVWRVESFTVADPNRPLLTEPLSAGMGLAPGQDRWQRLILDAGNAVYIQMGSGDYDFVDGKEDPQTGDLMLTDSGDANWVCRLRLQRPTVGTLQADGMVNGNHVIISFTLENVRESHLLDLPRWLSDGRRW